MDALLLPLLRLGLYADLMLLAGLAAWKAFGPEWSREPIGGTLPLSAMVLLVLAGLLLAAAAMLASIAAMMGQPLAELDGPTIHSILFHSRLGRVFFVRVAALALALMACAPLASRTARLRVVVVAAIAALGSLAWSGHAAATEGWLGRFHLANDTAHLLAAALWAGAIAGFALAACKPHPHAGSSDIAALADALRSFGPVGTVLVAAVTVTGLTNLLLTVGWSEMVQVWRSEYGALLELKLALFAAMLGAAAIHRWRLAPALHAAIERGGNREASLRFFRASLVIELLLAILVLAVVGWLGLSMPPEP